MYLLCLCSLGMKVEFYLEGREERTLLLNHSPKCGVAGNNTFPAKKNYFSVDSRNKCLLNQRLEQTI